MPRLARSLGFLAAIAAAYASLGAGCDGGAASSDPGAFEVRAESLVAADSALRYRASVGYPQIVGEGPGITAANRSLADSARVMVALYRPPGPLPAELLELNPGFEAFVEGGFETELVRDSLYSGLLAAYAFTGGAHGNQDFRPLNLDLRTGRTLTLPSFFRTGAAWRDTLAAHSTRQLAATLGPDVLFDGAVPADDPTVFRVFTLAPDSLVLHYPPYAVAPYVAGPQRVAVAWSALAPLLDPVGPARYFVTDRSSR